MKNGMPDYLIIEKELREKIEKGEYKSGERIPTEVQLCEKYKVSRITLRKALSILEAEGYIYRITGKGTFVIPSEKRDEAKIIKERQKEIKKLNKGVAILVPCITFTIFSGIVRGAEDYLREENYHLLLGNYDNNPEKEREYMEMFTERGIEGFIVSANYFSNQNSYYEELIKKNIPFVFADTPLEKFKADLIATNNIKGAYLGTKYLISRGCKKIAFLSALMILYSSERRFMGFRKAMEEGGLKPDEKIIKHGYATEEFGYDSIKEIMKKEKIDGIFSANEPITVGIVKALKDMNISKDDIKIVSFDQPVLPNGTDYDVKLIKQPRYEIGKISAKILLERIKEKKKGINSIYKEILLEPIIE
ncbi:MAG TPA: GntR family transcriptional regulator [bacterium]|nr:GntR family transcriptional regulator [bacterium]HOM26081.1 GntR family transcriptional regulator [bacterium]